MAAHAERAKATQAPTLIAAPKPKFRRSPISLAAGQRKSSALTAKEERHAQCLSGTLATGAHDAPLVGRRFAGGYCLRGVSALRQLYLTAELKAPERVTGAAFAGYFAVEMLLKPPLGAKRPHRAKTCLALGHRYYGDDGNADGIDPQSPPLYAPVPRSRIRSCRFFPDHRCPRYRHAPEEERGGMIGVLNLTYFLGMGISVPIGLFFASRHSNLSLRLFHHRHPSAFVGFVHPAPFPFGQSGADPTFDIP